MSVIEGPVFLHAMATAVTPSIPVVLTRKARDLRGTRLTDPRLQGFQINICVRSVKIFATGSNTIWYRQRMSCKLEVIQVII